MAPPVVAAIRDSGLNQDGIRRLSFLLSSDLGSRDTLLKLAEWPERPTDVRLYRTALLGEPDAIYVFAFLVTTPPDRPSAVVVAGCEHYRVHPG